MNILKQQQAQIEAQRAEIDSLKKQTRKRGPEPPPAAAADGRVDDAAAADALYDDLYCQRGEAENRIKEA